MALPDHTHTVDQVRQKVDYDPATGTFTWKQSKQKCLLGGVAGTVYPLGYRVIQIDGYRYMASHIAFAFMTGRWPYPTVDHIDRDPTNDRWGNLREATPTQQKVNQRVRSDSVTGVRGVSRPYNKYRARVAIEGKYVNLGLHNTVEAATAAVQAFRLELYGDFAEENM